MFDKTDCENTWPALEEYVYEINSEVLGFMERRQRLDWWQWCSDRREMKSSCLVLGNLSHDERQKVIKIQLVKKVKSRLCHMKAKWWNDKAWTNTGYSRHQWFKALMQQFWMMFVDHCPFQRIYFNQKVGILLSIIPIALIIHPKHFDELLNCSFTVIENFLHSISNRCANVELPTSLSLGDRSCCKKAE